MSGGFFLLLSGFESISQGGIQGGRVNKEKIFNIFVYAKVSALASAVSISPTM
jgi:hypothetical protein